MQKTFNDRAQLEVNEHPELAEADDPSAKDSSAAPTTSAGTPQPAANPTRIKLVTNGAGLASGGPSAAQSDGE